MRPILPEVTLLRQPHRSVGLVRGRWRDYGLAALYPLAVIGAGALIATAASTVDASRSPPGAC